MRKKLHIIFIFVLFYTVSHAQKLVLGIKISPDITFTSSKNEKFEKGPAAFGSSAGFSLELPISRKFSLGWEAAYIYKNRKLYTHYDCCIHIPEDIFYKYHFVYSHGIQLPFFIKYGKNNFYIFGQYGIQYFFKSKYRIDYLKYNINSPENIFVYKTLKTDLRLNAENLPVGQFAAIGIGKRFNVFKQIFSIELKYSFDLVNWIYKPDDNDIDELKFKTQSLSLTIGFIVKNKKRSNKCAELL